MAKTPEAKVKMRVTGILKAHGAYYFYPVTGGFGASGIPDIIGCVNGRFFGIECKAGSNKPTALQQHHINMITNMGGKAIVVNETNINDVEELMQCLKNI